MDFFKNLFSSTYEELWKAIIRPNRDNYRDKDLGPEKFCIKEKWYKRTDFTITNKRNHKLMCSFWEPFDEEREFPHLPCVIYLHGNSSSRCEVIPEIKYLLPRNITIFSFDFSGCGKSEGDYISLGWHEQDDVECVVNFLRKSNKVSTIGLWGRSMGAATALMYGSRDYSIAGLVLDSPFSSLKILIDELARERVSLPNFVINQAIKWIKEIIKEKADFNIDDIEPKEYAGKCFMPAYFCHAKSDTFVNIHHCKDLYNLYKGDKDIVYVKGNHNTERSIHFKDAVVIFFLKCLRCKELKKKNENNNVYDLKFSNETINYDKNNINTDLSIISSNSRIYKKNKNNTNNTINGIKISLRGKYNKNNSIEYCHKDKLNITNEKEKDEKSLISKSDKDIILNIDDNISIKKIIDCPHLKTNSNYIKYIHDANHTNINNNNYNCNSSILNKTPLKNNTEENTRRYKNKKVNQTYDKGNKTQNENEEEVFQKILQLSKKEFEEISTNTPNFINSYISTKYNNKTTVSLKKHHNKNLFKNSKKNSISIDNNKSAEVNRTIPMKSKTNIFLGENIFVNNNCKIINQNEYSNKLHTMNNMNNIKNKNKNQLNNKSKTNNNHNNNIFKNIKNLKSNKNNNISYISTYMNNCPKPSPIKIKFPDLIMQLNKNNKNDIKPINQKNQYNYNNTSIHHIYNLKNNKNIKLKDNNIKKEEHKNVLNNKRYDLIEKVIASPLNNIVHGSLNKKKIQYINTSNNTTSTNNFMLNNHLKKSESSIDNESDTIINSRIENKINESLIYLDDDNFFMEEDNMGINIPHS